MASLCVGSYFLAEAGLLSGKSCTSHWKAVDDMRRRYPDAEVLADAVVTDQDGRPVAVEVFDGNTSDAKTVATAGFSSALWDHRSPGP